MGIAYSEPAEVSNFDEAAYLLANPDLRKALADGRIKSGRHHFDVIGHSENRALWFADRIHAAKEAKLARIRSEMLSAPLPSHSSGAINALSEEFLAESGVTETDAVSANDYDPDILSYIEGNPSEWVLDAGSGLRPINLRMS
jgi:hypothetical protein